MSLTLNIYMIIISYKACKVLTSAILCSLPELYYVTEFKDLFRKITEAKLEEKCKKSNFLRLWPQ